MYPILTGLTAVAAIASAAEHLGSLYRGTKVEAETTVDAEEKQSTDIRFLLSRIPRFNGSGYEVWSTMMRSMLISQDLWDLVEEGYTEEELTVEASQYVRKKDADALLYILVTVDESVYSCIGNASTSKKAWDALQKKYQSSAEEPNLKTSGDISLYSCAAESKEATWDAHYPKKPLDESVMSCTANATESKEANAKAVETNRTSKEFGDFNNNFGFKEWCSGDSSGGFRGGKDDNNSSAGSTFHSKLNLSEDGFGKEFRDSSNNFGFNEWDNGDSSGGFQGCRDDNTSAGGAFHNLSGDGIGKKFEDFDNRKFGSNTGFRGNVYRRGRGGLFNNNQGGRGGRDGQHFNKQGSCGGLDGEPFNNQGGRGGRGRGRGGRGGCGRGGGCRGGESDNGDSSGGFQGRRDDNTGVDGAFHSNLHPSEDGIGKKFEDFNNRKFGSNTGFRGNFYHRGRGGRFNNNQGGRGGRDGQQFHKQGSCGGVDVEPLNNNQGGRGDCGRGGGGRGGRGRGVGGRGRGVGGRGGVDSEPFNKNQGSRADGDKDCKHFNIHRGRGGIYNKYFYTNQKNHEGIDDGCSNTKNDHGGMDGGLFNDNQGGRHASTDDGCFNNKHSEFGDYNSNNPKIESFSSFTNTTEPKEALDALGQGHQANTEVQPQAGSTSDGVNQSHQTRTISIQKLDKAIDEKMLHDVFSAFGNIISCKVVRDGSGLSKGHGYIEYYSEEAAQKSLEKMNGTLLNGKHVQVKSFVSKQERGMAGEKTKLSPTNVFVGNLSQSTTVEDLRNAFDCFGLISSIVVMRDGDGKSKCYGFVQFKDADDAAWSVEVLNGHKFDNKEWQVRRAYQNKFVGKTKKCVDESVLSSTSTDDATESKNSVDKPVQSSTANGTKSTQSVDDESVHSSTANASESKKLGNAVRKGHRANIRVIYVDNKGVGHFK